MEEYSVIEDTEDVYYIVEGLTEFQVLLDLEIFAK